jgi:excisionase family DNA binding protein
MNTGGRYASMHTSLPISRDYCNRERGYLSKGTFLDLTFGSTIKVPGKRVHLIEQSALLEEDLLTIEEVARRLRTSKTNVWRWIRQGALQAIALPKVYRIKKSEHLAFVKSNGMPPSLRQENLWTTEEIADWLRFDDTTIAKWINRQKIEAVRVDRMRGYLIKEMDLLAALGRKEIFPEDETVLITNEIADWLRIDFSAIRRWIKQGKLPAMNFSEEQRERYRVLESELAGFLGIPDGIPWQEKLLSLPEIADCMDLDPTSIQRWVKQGKLPAIIFPGEHHNGYRVLESELNAFVERWEK